MKIFTKLEIFLFNLTFYIFYPTYVSLDLSERTLSVKIVRVAMSSIPEAAVYFIIACFGMQFRRLSRKMECQLLSFLYVYQTIRVINSFRFPFVSILRFRICATLTRFVSVTCEHRVQVALLRHKTHSY